MNQDESHLNLLRIFHYVSGGLHLLAILFTGLYVFLGAMFLTDPDFFGGSSSNAPPPFMGWMFLVIGLVTSAMLLGYCVCQFITAWALGARKWWTFCVVVSGFNCINLPIGTILGVFTILVLARGSVKESFYGQPPAQPPMVGTV